MQIRQLSVGAYHFSVQ